MSLFSVGKDRAGKAVVGIVLLFLFAWPGNAAAVYKKKIAVEPLSNPAGWNDAFSPGAFIARMIEHSLKDTQGYQVLSAGQTSGQGQRHPAQVLIGGRVLTFRTPSATPSVKAGSVSRRATVEIELVIRDSFTQKKFAGKIFSGKSSAGRVAFRAADGEVDFSAPGFTKSAMGKALAALARQVPPFVSTTLNAVPFEAIIFSVDNEKREVVLNAGKINGVKPFDVFNIFSVEKNFIDPVTQHDLGEKITRQGVIRVETVLDDYSLAKITAGGDFEDGFVARDHSRPIPFRGNTRSWKELYGNLSNP
ncbi:MAG: hypothetical protein ACE5G9_12060 [Nitrospinales bacterium]